MKEYSFTCTDELKDLRIDKALSENYEELSRSYIQKLIKDELVCVNG